MISIQEFNRPRRNGGEGDEFLLGGADGPSTGRRYYNNNNNNNNYRGGQQGQRPNRRESYRCVAVCVQDMLLGNCARAHTHTHTHTHTHSHTHTVTHTHTHHLPPISLVLSPPHTHSHLRTHTHTHSHLCTHTHTDTHTRTGLWTPRTALRTVGRRAGPSMATARGESTIHTHQAAIASL